MKKLLAVLAVLALAGVSSEALAAPGDGNGTVAFNNYDSNNPIFHNNTSTRLPVIGSFVQVLGGPRGGTVSVLSSSTGQNIFSLAEPGFFDAGFGTVPGVAESAISSFQVRAWRGAADFGSAIEKGETGIYDQPTGTNPALPNLPAPAASVMPSFTVLIPEPSTIALGLLGASLLLFRRRQ